MKSPPPHKPTTQRIYEERQKRLAKALRENLRKRKEQVALRKSAETLNERNTDGLQSKS